MKMKPLQKFDHDNASNTLVASQGSEQHDQNHILCKHCSSDIPMHRLSTGFCCNGCKFVFQLIHNEHLDRFYQLKSNVKTQPKILLFRRSKNLEWVDALQMQDSNFCEFSIEGIECTACVWLMKTLAKRMNIPRIDVNSAMGRIRVMPKGMTNAQLKEYFSHLQEFGYRVFPLQSNQFEHTEGKELLFRMGILSASVMNSMMFSFAMYLGLTASEPVLFRIFTHLNFLFCTLAVGVGGSYFFRKAWAGLKLKIFHFDLPVSLGILTAYLGSTYSHFFGNQEHVYFDTLCTFIFLMILGRFLQVRRVERNRASIASSNDLENMRVKKIGEKLTEIPMNKIEEGDHLLIASGGLIPISCTLESPNQIEVSQEWITGESEPVKICISETILAGSQNISMEPIYVKALKGYQAGEISRWMFVSSEKSPSSNFWQTYSKKYALMVLGFLAFGFLLFAFRDFERAIKTAVTISLVTCPCGIGIAIPMAQMIAQRRLLSYGIYVRDLNLFENLKKITSLVFDKTGTLTLSELRIKNPQDLEELPMNETSVLFHAVAQSQHPVSRTIYQYLSVNSIPWKKVRVKEVPGKGLQVESEGENYFVGRTEMNRGLIFQKEGKSLLNLEFEESLLEDAKPVFQSLRQSGYATQILSGDKSEKVSEIADRLGLTSDQYLANCSPQQKEDWIKKNHPDHVLFLGDGLNDSLALRCAAISGVALSDSLSLASNANFYFSTLNIRWLPKMLQLGRRFSSVIKGNVAFSIFYNCTAVALSILGILTPLTAAVVMPTVSLIVVAVSMKQMKEAG
jgi:Cu2+-exporting ATPase